METEYHVHGHHASGHHGSARQCSQHRRALQFSPPDRRFRLRVCRERVFNWLAGTARTARVQSRRVPAPIQPRFTSRWPIRPGPFVMRNLTPGTYRVRGIIDENNNKGLDPREAWDTTTVALTDSAHVELYTFPHDSVGARLANVATSRLGDARAPVRSRNQREAGIHPSRSSSRLRIRQRSLL